MSANLKQYGEPINSGQAHLLSNNTWAYNSSMKMRDPAHYATSSQVRRISHVFFLGKKK